MGQAVGVSTVTAATVYIAPNTPSASAVELHVLVLGGIALGPDSRRESGSWILRQLLSLVDVAHEHLAPFEVLDA